MPSKRATSITPELQWFLFCEAVDTDEDGNFSFRNVFDRVRAGGFPAQLKFTVCAQFYQGVGAHKFWLKVVGPDERVIEEPEVQFWLASKDQAHRIQSRVNMTIAQGVTGRYEWTAMLDGRPVRTIALRVESDAPELADPTAS